MVHIKSKVPIKEALERSHGKIIARLDSGSYSIVVHGGGLVTKVKGSYVICTSKSLQYYTSLYPELDCQVDLSFGVINKNFDKFFVLDRNEHGYPVYRSVSGEIEVYFTGKGSFEVEYNFEIV